VQRFRLHLTDSGAGSPAVAVGRISDLERGCLHPESASGDTTCGSGGDQGELSEQLLVGLVTEPANSAITCDSTAPAAAATTLADLADVTLTSSRVDAADADTCLTLTLTLPASADNLVQSDAVAFDLRIGLLDATGAVEQGVSGASAGGAQRMTPAATDRGALPNAGGALPFTGVPTTSLLLLALGLIEFALAALAAGRRRPLKSLLLS
jgi:hypothetical protein